MYLTAGPVEETADGGEDDADDEEERQDGLGGEDGPIGYVSIAQVQAGWVRRVDVLPGFQSLLSKCSVCLCFISESGWREGRMVGDDLLAGRRLFFLSCCFGPVSSEAMESTWSTPL